MSPLDPLNISVEFSEESLAIWEPERADGYVGGDGEEAAATVPAPATRVAAITTITRTTTTLTARTLPCNVHRDGRWATPANRLRRPLDAGTARRPATRRNEFPAPKDRPGRLAAYVLGVRTNCRLN